ncbi:MAG TPA: class I SAM-dependent methyltransferase, partial [Candidatus Saccharicenans sp.]|nr:class I SAM-dependent methyltransferase [Candidatus Saccharicenans sp.]
KQEARNKEIKMSQKQKISATAKTGLSADSPPNHLLPDLLPDVLEQEISSRRLFFDRVASAWEEEHSEAEAEGDSALRTLVNRFDLEPGQVVLDAGCGTGRLLPLILEKIGPAGKLLAVDFSEKMLDIARKKYRAPNLIFYRADISQFKPPCQFDRIICLCLLPHLPDKLLALRTLGATLKPGGQLIVAHTASREEVNAFHARLPEPVCYDQLPASREMAELLQAAHLRLIELNEGTMYFLRAGRDDDRFDKILR